MNINFNFTKKFKKYLLFLFFSFLCFIIFNNNANAQVVNNSVINVNLGDYFFEDIWSVGSIDDLIDSNLNSYTEDLRIDLINYAISNTNSSSYDEFKSNYYYAIVAIINPNSSNKRVLMNLYYLSKENNDPFYFNFNFYNKSETLSSSITRLYASISPNVSIQSLGKSAVQQNADGTNYYSYGNNNAQVEWEFRKGQNGTSYTSFTYSNDEFNVNFYNQLNLTNGTIPNKYYIDTNVGKDLYFNDTTYYTGTYYTFSQMNLTDNDTTSAIYIGDLVYADYSGPIYLPPNVQTLSDNSYGINLNAVNNVVLSDDSNFTNFSINCPDDRTFLNGVCYIYNTDFTNFDPDFTDFQNEAQFLFSSSDINVKSGKYYILTFRLYTSYYLQPTAMVFTLLNNGNIVGNVGVNDIYKVQVTDSSLYKDFQIVFDMPSGVDNNVYGITILFDKLTNFTNTLDNNYTFGIFKTLKLTSYDSLPTSDIINSDYSDATLDSITSTNEFNYFTDFNVNDYGLRSIILMPLNYVSSLSNLVCRPINLPIPKIGNFELPCVSSFMSTNFNVIWSIYKVIVNGLICYRIAVNLFSDIKNMYRPETDSLEVIDL